jgi:hypothetical protein
MQPTVRFIRLKAKLNTLHAPLLITTRANIYFGSIRAYNIFATIPTSIKNVYIDLLKIGDIGSFICYYLIIVTTFPIFNDWPKRNPFISRKFPELTLLALSWFGFTS